MSVCVRANSFPKFAITAEWLEKARPRSSNKASAIYALHNASNRLVLATPDAPHDFPESERLAAYVDWACDGPFDYGDLVMFTDPRLREPLTERWNSRMGAWVDVPETLPADQRARLHGVRLLADGIWLNTAGNGIALSDEDTDAIRALAHHLIQENS